MQTKLEIKYDHPALHFKTAKELLEFNNRMDELLLEKW